MASLSQLPVVEIDDDLLREHQLVPAAAVVAAVAIAGEWYLLRFDLRSRELRGLASPVGPDRRLMVLRRRGQTIQLKVAGSRSSPSRWVPASAALARQYRAIAGLSLLGPTTATRSLVHRGGAECRVDIQISTGEGPARFAGASFAADPSGSAR